MIILVSLHYKSESAQRNINSPIPPPLPDLFSDLSVHPIASNSVGIPAFFCYTLILILVVEKSDPLSFSCTASAVFYRLQSPTLVEDDTLVSRTSGFSCLLWFTSFSTWRRLFSRWDHPFECAQGEATVFVPFITSRKDYHLSLLWVYRSITCLTSGLYYSQSFLRPLGCLGMNLRQWSLCHLGIPLLYISGLYTDKLDKII